MYQELLMDHYRYPRNKGTLINPDFKTGVINPSCGDSIALEGVFKGGLLIDIRFEGKGCVLSQAAASLLTEKVKGKVLSEIAHLGVDDMRTLVGISLGPTRLRCILLVIEALHQGIADYAQSRQNTPCLGSSNTRIF